jgi:hypothetical protein
MTFQTRAVSLWIGCLLLSFVLLGCQKDSDTPQEASGQQAVSIPAQSLPPTDPAPGTAAGLETIEYAAPSEDDPALILATEDEVILTQEATEERVAVAQQPATQLDEPQEAKPDGFDYYAISLDQLQLDDNKQLPPVLLGAGPQTRWLIAAGSVRLMMNTPAEGYIAGLDNTFDVRRNASSRVLERRRRINTELMIRIPKGKAASGALLVNVERLEDSRAPENVFTVFRFSTAKGTAATAQEVRDSYWLARANHYRIILDDDTPGGAWFRYQLQRSRSELPMLDFEPNRVGRRPIGSRGNEIGDTYALMSGGRALSENLQLDRQLPPSADLEEVIPLSTIAGITIREFDWQPLIQGLDPKLDPLSPLIPADQHVLFFPSFKALIRVADEASINGAAVLNFTQVRAEDAESQKRYETQLGFSLDATARLLGPTIIRSVAITGGDLYLRTGSDVAVLFEAVDAPALLAILLSQAELKTADYPGRTAQQGTIGGVRYDGFASDDRVISSYMTVLGDAVVVTNSTVQLKRLIDTFQNKQQSLAELDEYLFFRDRYPLDNPDQAGLLILSDQTIRRWCGPRWRIASARRTQAVARMTQLQAELLEQLVAGDLTARQLNKLSDGQFLLSTGGISSAQYGTLEFQTPINEMSLDKVSSEERQFYERWRNGYQSQWSNFFDPIAIEFTLSDQQLGADVTVMPLIDGTEYREMIAVSRGATLADDSGDRHPEAIVHAVLAINTKSDVLQENVSAVSNLFPQLTVNPLSWLGDEVTIYADKSDFWDQLAALSVEEMEEFLEENIHQLPIGVGIGVSNGLKLTLFMTGVRVFIEQAAPGMTTWGVVKYKNHAYAVIRPSAQVRGDLPNQEIALYYRTSGKQLLLSLNEDIIKRSIDRQLAQAAGDVDAAEPVAATVLAPWIGDNVGFQLGPAATSLLKTMARSSGFQMVQSFSWSNLPILNEWHRLFPDEDPVELHRKFWHRRLVCPGGGEYRWNEELQTMESTVFGCPAAPRDGPTLPAAIKQIKSANLGLSFETNGLRARIQLERKE